MLSHKKCFMLPFKHLNTSSPGWNASWYLCSLATVGCTMNSYYSQTFLALRDGNRIISSKQTTRKTAKNVLGHTAVVIQNDDIDMMKWLHLQNDDKSYRQQCLNYVFRSPDRALHYIMPDFGFRLTSTTFAAAATSTNFTTSLTQSSMWASIPHPHR